MVVQIFSHKEHLDSFFLIGEKAEVGPDSEKSKNQVAQQQINAITPKTQNGIGSEAYATNGAVMHNPLATILQKANREDFISAGKSSFEVRKVKLQQGQRPNLLVKTNTAMKTLDLLGKKIQRSAEIKHIEKKIRNDFFQPKQFIIGAATKNEIIIAKPENSEFSFISPSMLLK